MLHSINRSYKLRIRLTPISPFQVCTPRNTLIVTKHFTQYNWIWCTVDTKQCHQTRVWWMTMNWATVCDDVLCSSVHLVCRRTPIVFLCCCHASDQPCPSINKDPRRTVRQTKGCRELGDQPDSWLDYLFASINLSGTEKITERI